MEHTSGGKADVIEGARESLLAASVSHPNVIPCYKVGERQSGHVCQAAPHCLMLLSDGHLLTVSMPRRHMQCRILAKLFNKHVGMGEQ